MKNGFKILISIVLCVILIALLGIMDKQTQLKEKLDDKPKVVIEEPQRITGKWQILLFKSGIFPPKIIKTNYFYSKDKIIWYADPLTGVELPLPEGDMIVPDDGRDLEQYGVYKITDMQT